MEPSGYRSGATAGGKWGCALAAVLGVPLIGVAFLAGVLGDCLDQEPCGHGIIWELMVPAILIPVAVGLGARVLINWYRSRRNLN